MRIVRKSLLSIFGSKSGSGVQRRRCVQGKQEGVEVARPALAKGV